MIEVFTDGGARGNPGPAAYGFIVRQNGQIIKKDGGYIGLATNNVAEYTAVIKALTWLKNHFLGQDLKFYLDSQLVVLQLSGVYKVKNSNLRNLIVEIRGLETNFGQVSYHHVPRQRNKEADRLVNQALDGHLWSSKNIY